MVKSFGLKGAGLYFCTPKKSAHFEDFFVDLVAQLVEHPDFIGRALSEREKFL